MQFNGAGGSNGGTGSFFIGLVMMIAGGYLFLNSIHIDNHFNMGRSIYNFGGFNITSGMTLIPFIFGIGIVFFNSKNYLGWFLVIASLIMLGFGIISGVNFRLRHMTAFELITILVLLIGGIGLFLSSFRSNPSS